jgi:uncharacterized protein (DUF169 family)
MSAPLTEYTRTEALVADTLALTTRPVAVAFRETPPIGVAKFEGAVASTCSFWRLAASRPPFYTVQADHYNCPIGAYTHNIPLPENRAPELTQTLELMARLEYVRMEEVPAIPRLTTSPHVIVYGSLGDMPVRADVVVLSGRPQQLMWLQEAALRAGAAVTTQLLGRPTCMALPIAMTGTFAASLGCVGNRIYTDTPDDEIYVTVAGRDIGRIAEQLATIRAANQMLADYHRERRRTLSASA